MQCYPKGEPSLVVKSPRPFVPYQGYHPVIHRLPPSLSATILATFAVGTNQSYVPQVTFAVDHC